MDNPSLYSRVPCWFNNCLSCYFCVILLLIVMPFVKLKDLIKTTSRYDYWRFPLVP